MRDWKRCDHRISDSPLGTRKVFCAECGILLGEYVSRRAERGESTLDGYISEWTEKGRFTQRIKRFPTVWEGAVSLEIEDLGE